DYHRWTPFHPEALKLLLDELVTGAGVEVLFFTRLVDVLSEANQVNFVVLHNIGGIQAYRARAFIDCTGDAELAFRAGAKTVTNPHFMPGTLCSLHTGVDWDRFDKGRERSQIFKAVADGFFSQPDRHVPGLSRSHHHLAYLNAGHLFGHDALDPRQLSAAMIRGRRLIQEYVAFYRKYMPGCENMHVAVTAALLGVRETRRIVGEYTLCFDDYAARRQFPDQIGVFNKFVDIHVRDCSDAEYERFLKEKDDIGRLQPGECFGIPYRILVPRGWRNLWVAGRCNSSDERVHGSIRVMPAASMMGQAAGTAAWLAIRQGRPAFDIDIPALIAELRRQGAYLPQS
ncbi:MAG: FAD-dependent oxidoreductase, partial [Lentisphaerae bacterium]